MHHYYPCKATSPLFFMSPPPTSDPHGKPESSTTPSVFTSYPHSHDTTCKVLYDLVHFMSLQHHLLPLSILNLNPSHPELLAVPQILHVPSCFQSLCSSCFFCRGFLSSFSISLTPVNPYDLAQSYFLQAASLTPTFGWGSRSWSVLWWPLLHTSVLRGWRNPITSKPLSLH